MPFVIHLLNSNQCKIISWNFTNKCYSNSVWSRYSVILLEIRGTIFPTSKCIRCCLMCIQLNIKIVSNQFKLKYAWVWCKFNDARRLEGASYWHSIWLPSTNDAICCHLMEFCENQRTWIEMFRAKIYKHQKINIYLSRVI